MMNKNGTVLMALLSLVCFSRCNSGGAGGSSSIATDSASIAAGETSFTKNCSGCHNFKQDGIGPQLSGVTGTLSPDWLLHFIKNSQQLIASGDASANQLFTRYKKSVMPPFESLQDAEVKQLIAYMHAQKAIVSQAKKKNDGISNPIPGPIGLSNLVVNLQPVTQFPATSDKPPLARITKLGFQPLTGNLFMVDLQGRLYKMHNEKPAVYLDIAKLKTKFINKPGLAAGFGSFAFHPDFARNGLLYTTHTEAPGSGKADFGYADTIKVTMQWVLTEWKTATPNADSFSGTSREMLRVNMVTGIHGVQEIIFNPLAKKGDKEYGLLYIGVGDGGSAEAGFAFLEHSTEKIWGTIIRIDPLGKSSSNGQYSIPPGNPFVNSSNDKTVREIYAYGFRNPHRITWTKSGTMLASNIGQANIESLYEVQPGHDYGWPIREGNFVSAGLNDNLGNVYPLPANDSSFKITYPVAEFDHDEGKAISGGFEYWGNAIPALKGKFLFGDIPSGRLFYLDVADLKQGKMATIKEWKITINGKPETLKAVCGSDRIDLHFGRDMQGELYVLTKADGKMYKMVGAELKP
jgi:glucose/arabinose dehydrogenase/mono/diheme cytochrome c family protein